VELLLQHPQLNVNLRGMDGYTALIRACQESVLTNLRFGGKKKLFGQIFFVLKLWIVFHQKEHF
jgi:hypothetical protein